MPTNFLYIYIYICIPSSNSESINLSFRNQETRKKFKMRSNATFSVLLFLVCMPQMEINVSGSRLPLIADIQNLASTKNEVIYGNSLFIPFSIFFYFAFAGHLLLDNINIYRGVQFCTEKRIDFCYMLWLTVAIFFYFFQVWNAQTSAI